MITTNAKSSKVKLKIICETARIILIFIAELQIHRCQLFGVLYNAGLSDRYS